MADFYSERFRKNVWITHHARESMHRRGVDVDVLINIIEAGEIKYRNAIDLWVYMAVSDRTDNLICAAVIEQSALIVKTVMINWEMEEKHED